MPPAILPALFMLTLTSVLTVGSPARLFTLPAINEEIANELIHHEQVSLGDFINPGARVPRKAIVIYFFNLANGGNTLATLNKIAKRTNRQEVQVIGIHTDAKTNRELEALVTDLDLVYPVLDDRHSIVSMRYEIRELPLTIIVDEEGQIVSIGNPKGNALEEEIDAGLTSLVGG